MTNVNAAQKRAAARLKPGTVSDWFTIWEHGRDVTPERQAADRTRFNKYIVPKFGPTDIPKVTERSIQNWVEAPTWKTKRNSSEPVGESTRYATIMVLRQVLQTAVDAGLLTKNPAAKIQFDRSSANTVREQADDDVLAPEDADRLVEKMDGHYQALVLLGLRLGATWAEAMGLQEPDIDFKAKRIRLGRLLGVESAGRVRIKPGDADRTVTMPNDLQKALAAFLHETADIRDGLDEPWVFITPSGSRPLRANWNRYVLRPALRAAGLPEVGEGAPTFHTFRHTAARDMLRNGKSMFEVSRTLGHKSEVTTQRYYRSFVPAD